MPKGTCCKLKIADQPNVALFAREENIESCHSILLNKISVCLFVCLFSGSGVVDVRGIENCYRTQPSMVVFILPLKSVISMGTVQYFLMFYHLLITVMVMWLEGVGGGVTCILPREEGGFHFWSQNAEQEINFRRSPAAFSVILATYKITLNWRKAKSNSLLR